MENFLGRENHATLIFETVSDRFRNLAGLYDSANLHGLIDSLIDSISCFGKCELYARKGERATVLGLYPNLTQYCTTLFERQNVKGLNLLDVALTSLANFRIEYNNEPGGGDMPDLSFFATDFRDIIIEMNMKASDANKLNIILNEVLDVAINDGDIALLDYIEDKITELNGLRNQPDRGNVENIFVWKIAAIAAMLGIAIFIIVRCGIKNKYCFNILEYAAYAAGWTIAGLIALYCNLTKQE